MQKKIKTRKEIYNIVMELRKQEGLGRRRIHKRLCEMGYYNYSGSIQRKQDKLFSLIKNYKRYFVPSTEIDKLIPDIKKYLNIGYSQRKTARLLGISPTGVKNRMKYCEV